MEMERNNDIINESSWMSIESKNPKIVAKLGKANRKLNDPNRQKQPADYFLEEVSGVTINDQITERLANIRRVPYHQNISPILNILCDKSGGKVRIISQFMDTAIPFNEIVEKKMRFDSAGWVLLFYRIVSGLSHYERYGVYHLNINPQSVLTFLPQQSMQKQTVPMISLTSPAVIFEPESPYAFCQHPDIFNGKIDTFGLEPPTKYFKYDLWSLGVLMYGCFMYEYPFLEKQFFGNKRNFKKKLTQPSENKKFIKKLKDKLKESFFTSFIQSCWNHENPQFQNWNQVKIHFQQRLSISPVEKRSIVDIAEKHIRLMYLLSQIYILICTQTRFNFHQIWRLLIIRRFAQSIIKLAHIYHFKFFNVQFENRIKVLTYSFRQTLHKIGEQLNEQYEFMKKNQIFKALQNEQMGLKQILKTIQKTPIALKMQIQKVRGSFKSLDTFRSFVEHFHDCLRKQISYFDSQINWTMLMLDSEELAKIAEDNFGFCLKEIYSEQSQ